MASNINPTLPGEVHAYTADVRANFAAAKAEIEALQAQSSNNVEVSVFNFMTAAQITDFRAGTLSFDFSVPLQAAIDYSTVLATYANNRSMIALRVPGGNGRIDNQVTVKAHVILDCEGVIKGNIASAITPAMVFKQGSHCQRLTLDANSQYGIQFGDAGVTNGMSINEVRVLNGSLAASRLGILFVGDGFAVSNVEVDGGRTGVAFGDGTNTCTRVMADRIRVYNAFDGITFDLCQSIYINRIVLDSCTNSGGSCDRSSDISLSNISAYFVDAAPGTCFAAGYVFTTGGAASATIKVTNFRGCFYINNTGGTGLTVGSNINNSLFCLDVSRATLFSGNAHNSTTALVYSGAVDASNAYTMRIGTGITATSGIVTGNLLYWDGTTETHKQPVQAPSFKFDSSGTLRGFAAAAVSADQSLVTTTALTNVTSMLFPIAANEEWVATFTLDVGAALATTGIKVAVTTPAAAAQEIRAFLTPDVPTLTARDAQRTTVSGTALDFTAAQQASVGNAQIKVDVHVVNSATPGNVQLQFAQSTSSGTALLIRKGSFVQADRVA